MTAKLLTIDQSALVLNVGRDYVVRLLDEGRIAFVGDGDSRMMEESAALSLRARRDGERHDHLQEITRLSEEAGGYDDFD